MKKLCALLIGLGTATGLGSIVTAAPALAGHACPPPLAAYTKTTQYWPVVRTARTARFIAYRPIRARRR